MLAVLTRMHKRFSSDDKASDECQRPPVRVSKRFVRRRSVADRRRLEASTTFTMKKRFGLKRASRIWAQIGDSLGTCNLEEDQVRLLSVLAQNSFSVSDDSSDDSDCGGRDNQLMASSEDESSSDSEAEDKIPAKYSAILKQAHVLNNSASSEEVITPCDPHASEPIINNNNNNDLPSFNNAENLIASKDQDGNSPNDPSINDPTSAVVQDKMEWVFTLYDFDGKGSLTKEDIGSLARSIYDVLGNAKVPLQSKCGAARAGQAIGAFRVKLTVVAESAELDAKQQPPATVVNDLRQSTTNVISSKADDAQKPTVTSTKHSMANATIGDRRESKSRRKVSTADQKDHPQEKVPRKRAGVRCAPPLWQYPPWQRCACNAQDYVNLSELENCCSKHTAAHSSAHHVRHCEQHCNCFDRKPLRPSPPCLPCRSPRNCCTNAAFSRPQPPPSTRRIPCQAGAPSTMRQERPARPRSPSSTDHVIAGSPCRPHERKHRERDKQHERSMRLVRQWLLDAASTIDDDPRILPLRRSFVQHRHVHEHHHYVHHADI